MSLFRPASSRPSAGAAGDASATLVAIARNEGRYILEWVAHHLAVGFASIIVYDDRSTDDTRLVLERIAAVCPAVVVRPCGTVGFHDSPQTTAYNAAVPGIVTAWTMFLDVDEFLVPFRDYAIDAFLARVPPDVASVHFNWRNFGSNGRGDADYALVVEAFTRCAPAQWGNHHHFKSIARTALIERVSIHNIATTSGRRVLSDLGEFETVHNGLSNRISHDGVQINHYQSKTYPEFKARMERGDANYHPDHALRPRDASRERFLALDRNEEEDTAALVFAARFARYHRGIVEAMRADRHPRRAPGRENPAAPGA